MRASPSPRESTAGRPKPEIAALSPRSVLFLGAWHPASQGSRISIESPGDKYIGYPPVFGGKSPLQRIARWTPSWRPSLLTIGIGCELRLNRELLRS